MEVRRTYDGAYCDEADGFGLLDRSRLCCEVDNDLSTVHRRRDRHLVARGRVTIDAAGRHHDSRRHRLLHPHAIIIIIIINTSVCEATVKTSQAIAAVHLTDSFDECRPNANPQTDQLTYALSMT